MDNIKVDIDIKNTIRDADMILVGIGEEFEIELSGMWEEESYKSFLNKIKPKEANYWMVPYAECVYLREGRNDKTANAYAALERLLEGKNYFIVSTCIDDSIYRTGVKEERIVTPCGGYHSVQCAVNCTGDTEEPDKYILDKIYNCLYAGGKFEEIEKPVCVKCRRDIVFNNIKAEHYAEEGYLEQWNRYTKWLQGTVNRKLCLLELGVGMKFPTAIRWPFEKIAFFNQKSNLIRVHSKLYQMTEEIKERGYSIKENPTDFLINWFV